MEITYTLEQINETVWKVYEAGKAYKVWTFYAEMGTGKTTFIKALCEYLKVKDTISSPTYSIINQYKTDDGKIIYHMDWYRLKSEEEAIDAGVEDALFSGNLCMVEWPERAENLLPESYLKIDIELLADGKRRLTLNV